MVQARISGDLGRIPAYHKKRQAMHVVIETPKGSHNKYNYNPEFRCFEFGTVLPEGMTFPYDFGFIPSTLGDDGDPIDILILMDFPVMPGCLLKARLIGAIQAEQKEMDGKWLRNDRLIGVSVDSRVHEGVSKLKDMRPHTLEQIIAFFQSYNEQHDKKFKPIGNCSADAALKLVKRGVRNFQKMSTPK
jgi:inorganic pyrophosphatase